MEVTCPHCQQPSNVQNVAAYEKINCTACGKTFIADPENLNHAASVFRGSDEEILPEGGIFLRIFAVGLILFAVVGIIGRFTNPFPWLLLVSGLILFALGLIVKHLKQIELHLRPDNRNKQKQL